MPLFRLSEHIDFPPPWFARSDGLLCVGGDLSPKRLLLAYKKGIFPWFSKNEPILWWSPDPRLVLFPENIRVSRSLNKTIRKNKYTIRVNTAFEQTILCCAKPRKKGEEGTWLIEDMIEAYIELHALGHAHSVEAWLGDRLAGGLYGVSIGRSFFGESMFSSEKDASKVALVALANLLRENKFDMIDCQVTTSHLLNMGAVEISRTKFIKILDQSVKKPVDSNIWKQPSELIL